MSLGVDLPPLNSPQSVVWNEFMAREDRIECEKARFQLMAAVGANPAASWVDDLNKSFKEYTNLVTNVEYEENKKEQEWADFYEHIRHTAPEFRVAEDGSISIENIFN